MNTSLLVEAVGAVGRVAVAREARTAPAYAPSLVLVGISEAKP